MFDGVHRGHQYVLRQVVETARERGMQSLVVTFDHLLRKDAVLTTLGEKRQLIGSMGVDRTEVLAFTDELRQMTARQFMERVLCDQLDVKVLLTGYDNRFGHRREEGFDDYVRYGRELGIEVHQLRAEGTVSSSHIRQLLQRGNVAEAAHCLGRCYTLSGHVEHGEHVGTQLGFPTANLHPDCDRQLIPAAGVYAVRAHIARPWRPISSVSTPTSTEAACRLSLWKDCAASAASTTRRRYASNCYRTRRRRRQ